MLQAIIFITAVVAIVAVIVVVLKGWTDHDDLGRDEESRPDPPDYYRS